MQRTLSQRRWGFSTIEVVVTVIIVAILAAIAGPNLFGFLQKQRLADTNNKVFEALRDGRSRGIRAGRTVRAEFALWNAAANPNSYRVYDITQAPPVWETLPFGIEFASSTCALVTATGNPAIQFDFRGNVTDATGLSSQPVNCTICTRWLPDPTTPGVRPDAAACAASTPNDTIKAVVQSTLLGKMRKVE